MTKIKKSFEGFFAEATERFGRHAEHGGEILQRHLIKKFRIFGHQFLKALPRGHVQVAENALFKQDETACDKKFVEVFPPRNAVGETEIRLPVNGEKLAVGKRLDVPPAGRIEDKTRQVGHKITLRGNPLGHLFAVHIPGNPQQSRADKSEPVTKFSLPQKILVLPQFHQFEFRSNDLQIVLRYVKVSLDVGVEGMHFGN